MLQCIFIVSIIAFTLIPNLHDYTVETRFRVKPFPFFDYKVLAPLQNTRTTIIIITIIIIMRIRRTCGRCGG